MTIFYNDTTKGFYNDAIHTTIPQGSVEVSSTLHMELISQQGKGKVITIRDGQVVTVDRTVSVSWDDIRKIRDNLLTASDWTQLQDSPLSTTMKSAWIKYRTELRNITDTYKTPEEVIWPSSPN